MSHDLPDDWYIEPTGESMILDQEKVAAEIERLRAALRRAIEMPHPSEMEEPGGLWHQMREALGNDEQEVRDT